MSTSYSSLKKTEPLQKILQRPDLWKGRKGPVIRSEGIPSGYKELDKELLHKGWPVRGLIEFQQQCFGQSEWHLLFPCLRNLLAEGYIALINPPFTPYAPALIQQGIAPEKLLVIQAEQKTDWLVSVRETLAANCCIALLCWEPKQRLLYPELRKLQLAISQSDSLGFLLRKTSRAKHKAYSASPAVLRLLLQNTEQGLQIYIDKQRGSYARAQLLLPWPNFLLESGAFLSQKTFSVEAVSAGKRPNNILFFDGRA